MRQECAAFQRAVAHAASRREHAQDAKALFDVVPADQQKHELNRQTQALGALDRRRCERPEQPRTQRERDQHAGDQVAQALPGCERGTERTATRVLVK